MLPLPAPATATTPAPAWRTSRSHRFLVVSTTLALVLAGMVTLVEPARAVAYRTTASLNLRSGPGASYDVIRVIPSGATVDVTGAAENGYLPLTYDGDSGYAAAAYLTAGGGGGTTTGPTGTRYVVDGRLNLRSGPGSTYGILAVMPDGAAVQLTGQIANGYAQVTYNGTTGWAYTDYLSTSPGSTDDGGSDDGGSGVAIGDTVTGSATTTARLNLRTGPGTGYNAILTMPSGASVEVMGASQAGFLPLRYNGTKGWAAVDYLRTGTTPDDGGDDGGSVGIGDTVTGSATTTTRLNLRTGPGLGYGVILTMASGTRVDLMGAAQAGFLPVRTGGTKGWASASYLTTGGDDGGDDGGSDGGSGVPIGDTVTGRATTTARLNLRTGPGVGYTQILTMTSGATVDVMGSAQGGFLPVRYNGTKGWASDDFLTTGGSDDGGGDDGGNDGGAAGEDMVTVSAVNMRSGPGTSYGVVWVLPPGTRIDVTGSAQNGYYPASWAHVSGFVHGDYLVPVSQWVDPGAVSTRDQQMIEIIYGAADRWGQPRADMLRVARCESALDPNAVNPRSGTSGLFQFRPSTFAITPNGRRGENIFDPWSNADAAGWMWANGMRNHWACQ